MPSLRQDLTEGFLCEEEVMCACHLNRFHTKIEKRRNVEMRGIEPRTSRIEHARTLPCELHPQLWENLVDIIFNH